MNSKEHIQGEIDKKRIENFNLDEMLIFDVKLEELDE